MHPRTQPQLGVGVGLDASPGAWVRCLRGPGDGGQCVRGAALVGVLVQSHTCHSGHTLGCICAHGGHPLSSYSHLVTRTCRWSQCCGTRSFATAHLIACGGGHHPPDACGAALPMTVAQGRESICGPYMSPTNKHPLHVELLPRSQSSWLAPQWRWPWSAWIAQHRTSTSHRHVLSSNRRCGTWASKLVPAAATCSRSDDVNQFDGLPRHQHHGGRLSHNFRT